MSTFVWQPTNAQKQTRHDDIWFISAIEGWAINSNGQILKTSDAGETWTEQAQVGIGTWLRCIAFANSQQGWVGSTSRRSRLWNTANGGASWSKATNIPPIPNAICGIWAVDSDTVYAAGTNYPNRPTGILKTTDGGATWVSISMERHADLLVDIYFISKDVGWVVGGKGGSTRPEIIPVVLHTTDGGQTWINQLEGMDAQFPKGEWGWKVQFIDAEIGFVSLENFEDGAILKTEDGGATWVRLPINDAQGNVNLEGIGFLNATTGWVGGWGDRDFKGGYTSETENGGADWSDANYVGKFINRFRFTGDANIPAYASGDTIYRYIKSDFPIRSELSDVKALKAASKLGLSLNDIIDIEDNLEFSVDVPAGAKRLTVEVWDRFAAYVKEVHDQLSPPPGSHRITWDLKDDEGLDVEEGHFIYRVTLDDTAESQIFYRRTKDAK